jgi:hypothetical protein
LTITGKFLNVPRKSIENKFPETMRKNQLDQKFTASDTSELRFAKGNVPPSTSVVENTTRQLLEKKIVIKISRSIFKIINLKKPPANAEGFCFEQIVQKNLPT